MGLNNDNERVRLVVNYIWLTVKGWAAPVGWDYNEDVFTETGFENNSQWTDPLKTFEWDEVLAYADQVLDAYDYATIPLSIKQIKDRFAENESDIEALETAIVSKANSADVTTLIQNAINALLDGAPAALDTLNELAAAINDNGSFASTITAALADKVDKVSGKGLSTNDFDNTYKSKLDAITGAVVKQEGTITRGTGASSATQDITTTFQPSLIFFSAVDDANASINSDGWDTGSVCTHSRCAVQNVLLDLLGGLTGVTINSKDHSNSVYILSGGAGWRANVSAVASNKFTLNWTKVGAGRNITVKYLAIK
jgi:hypothetical protein